MPCSFDEAVCDGAAARERTAAALEGADLGLYITKTAGCVDVKCRMYDGVRKGTPGTGICGKAKTRAQEGHGKGRATSACCNCGMVGQLARVCW